MSRILTPPPPQSNSALRSKHWQQGPRRPPLQESRSLSKPSPNNQMRIAAKSSVKPHTLYMNNGNKDDKGNFGPKTQSSRDLCIHHYEIQWAMKYLVSIIKCALLQIKKVASQVKKNKHQYCFANISATKARIFIKFYVVVNYYLVSLSSKFHKDPCANARARVVNVRTRDKTCVCVFTTHARAFKDLSSWNLKLKITR